MAWTTDSNGVPYYKPEAPEQPAPTRIPQADFLGGQLLSSMAHAAVATQQASLDRERMMQSAELATRQLDYQKERDASEFELKKSYYDYLKTKNGDIIDRTRERAQKAFDVAEAFRQRNDSIADLDTRAVKAAQDLKLDDANWRANNPVKWLANAKQFQNRFGLAVEGSAPELIKKYQSIGDQMKVPFKEDGADKPSQRPLSQIVEQWQNPDLRQTIEKGLIQGGHVELIPQIERTHKKFLGYEYSTKDEPGVPIKQLDAYGRQITSEAGKVDLNKGANEVPPDLTRKMKVNEIKAGTGGDGLYDPNTTRAGRLNPGADLPAELPEPDLPPTTSAQPATPNFEPTATDKLIAQAKAALQANPQARDEILRRLIARGIQPTALA